MKMTRTTSCKLARVKAGMAWLRSLQQGYAGLKIMALIPGTAGAAPVQNIGAYGMELQDRFHSLDAIDIRTGHKFQPDAAQCGFSYRDSIFKRIPTMHLRQMAKAGWLAKPLSPMCGWLCPNAGNLRWAI